MCFLPGEAASKLNLYRYQITSLCDAIDSRLGIPCQSAKGELFTLVVFVKSAVKVEKEARVIFAMHGMPNTS